MTKSFMRCETCNKDFTGPEPFAEHLMSKAHLKKTQGKGLESLPQTDSSANAGQKSRCDVCEIDLSGPTQIQQHMNGSKHLSMLNKKRILVSLPQDQQQEGAGLLRCEICEKCFSGPESYEDHIKSKKHGRKISMALIKERIENQEPASCPPAADIPAGLNGQASLYPALPRANSTVPNRGNADTNIKKKPTGCLSAFKSILKKKKVQK